MRRASKLFAGFVFFVFVVIATLKEAGRAVRSKFTPGKN